MKRRTIILAVAILVAVAGYLAFVSKSQTSLHRVGVVVPLEHRAMTDIVSGFRSALLAEMGEGVQIDVQNAQGDKHLQQAILDTFSRRNYDVVVTIGTDLTLMAHQRVPTAKLVALDVTDQVPGDLPRVSGVRETSIEPSYRFLRRLLPHLHHLAMVYSASDKNYKMVEQLSAYASRDGITTEPIMVYALSDLYTLAGSVSKRAECLFITKDHLVACGAPALARAAEQLGIPFITSDEGSVLSGAAAAVGNRESDIGKRGGEITAALLQGAPSESLPIAPLEEFTLFYNEEACRRQGIDLLRLASVAYELGYPLERVDGEVL